MAEEQIERIYLIGYMGCGKTTLGKLLAHRTGYNFLDTDQLIEERYKLNIYDFFHNQGEDEFRKLEHEILLETFHMSRVIVSTGGGTPCYYNNMNLLNQYGFSIYLQMPPQLLYERLKKTKRARPLTAGQNEGELLEFIRENLKEREYYYKQAAVSVASFNLKAKDLETMINHYHTLKDGPKN